MINPCWKIHFPDGQVVYLERGALFHKEGEHFGEVVILGADDYSDTVEVAYLPVPYDPQQRQWAPSPMPAKAFHPDGEWHPGRLPHLRLRPPPLSLDDPVP